MKASSINRLPLSDQIYRLLLESIISGKRNAGARISEESISAEFGISRTPAREALMRLAADGLIERTARKGCRIAKRDETEMRDMIECRAHMEKLALSLAFDAIPEADLERLQAILSDSVKMEDTKAALAADDMLHGLISTHCPNRTLAATIESLRHRLKANRILRAAAVDASQITAERMAIVLAIRHKERDTALALIHAHVLNGMGT